MTPQQFIAKWSQIQQKETAVSQSHFNDICQLVGHAPPLEHDPSGRDFSFETQTAKPDGAKGFADVFYRERFIWEYKGPHKDLEKAYQQLQLYREALENPPLLITSDIHTIVIHTNFNNYPILTHTITFDELLHGDGVEKLGWAFFTPERFKPAKTRQNITKATADSLLRVAEEMKKHRDLLGDEAYSNEQLAHFLVRLLFALFAEDMGLLPDNLFTQVVRARGDNYAELRPVLQELFAKMRDGGTFGLWPIRHFNGTLFDDDFVPDIPHDLGRLLLQAAEQDWAQVDPSIFGTLFERVIDEGKRAQLGAHYTSEDDIMLIVEPVLMAPLRQKWDTVRRKAAAMQTTVFSEKTVVWQQLTDFAQEIASVRVLDPACGSGNFLYVALRQLLGLQKEVIAFAARKGLPAVGQPPIPLTVNPEQLYGIEINPYAHELAQITAWIGYLQWRNENGFGDITDPILRPLHNIQRMDAILAYDENNTPTVPNWPAADVIIGNPPFLGNKKMRTELGSKYVEDLRGLYPKLSGQSDLVIYWFERAKKQIGENKARCAGLIATQAIRMGGNRLVLDRIKASGNIFMAWSDKDWILDGASVRVSIVGFDDGSISKYMLDGEVVSQINSDLTSQIDLTQAERLNENTNLTFQGPVKVGAFDIQNPIAEKMLLDVNTTDIDNSDVVKPWMNASDVTKRPRNMWIIDFEERSLDEAAMYKLPFEYVEENIRSFREKNNDRQRRTYWWRLGRSGSDLKAARQGLSRVIITPRVAKHRIFIWANVELLPDSRLFAITREDDYFFGVLHSRVHETWSLATSSRHGDGSDGGRPTYNNTTCFETFPFPWPPGQEPSEATDERVAAIAHWARALVAWRANWLNPPRDGLYAGLGTAYDKMVKKRTLTNLYNGLVYYRSTVRATRRVAPTAPTLWDQTEFDKVTRKSVTRADIQELDDIHAALDQAVLDAYGWPHDLTDEQILERLLALNLERASGQ
ncbi:class I SAM-dependent DNA methyltransferase [Candidatus Leptofilum sp.]|uniref:class I SAM-dependent DNA methyltransferase n=1 Tax=Candidatus Leptofilum sp. TaxID=3241576 RepID=UPI003B5ADCE0